MGGNGPKFLAPKKQTQPLGLTVDNKTGVLIWNLSDPAIVDGLYSASLQIIDPHGCSTTLDFMFKLQTYLSNDRHPPIFEMPPTPPQSADLYAWVDTPFTFEVGATHPTKDPGLRRSILPRGMVEENRRLGGKLKTSPYSLTPTADMIGANVICFTAEYTLTGQVVVTLPHCFALNIYRPCINLCTAPNHGTCMPNYWTPGTCKCNKNYCLEDCRAYLSDDEQATNCVPKTFAPAMQPNTRSAFGPLHILANMPTIENTTMPVQNLGNEIWIPAPPPRAIFTLYVFGGRNSGFLYFQVL
eukprot:NODE_745_length_1475_cov_79.862553_g617_i0.p1 GENE.NODE_745_length_1475_cov_79.862553_g617_i0~~NODE_745_length_1475_cov_79.862553_g617_i0.p1  ORF type:complete len:299 (-),score=58.91 NODE_745_length_1475_cov_79.862553_g617_i0:96-992(-)